jgi:hypothetical protein
MTKPASENKDRQDKREGRLVAAPAVFTPPSQDEEAFLKNIEEAGKRYDPSVTVGGPRNFTA